MAKVALNVRIAPELRETMIRLAKEEHRTLSNLVELLLLNYAAKTEPKNRRG